MGLEVDIKFPAKDEPLRRDVSILGAMLGEILREQEPGPLYERVESVRSAARRWRSGEKEALPELQKLLSGLTPDDGEELVRAFSAYFFLVNMAERVHRIRRRIDYLRTDGAQPGSWRAVFETLKTNGVSAEAVLEGLSKLRLEPVFTAHPTEAMRRTLLLKEQRIARALVDRLEPDRIPGATERAALARIRGEVVGTWQTDENLAAKPTVADEVEHMLFYVSEVIYRIVPRFYEDIEEAFREIYGPEYRLPEGGPQLSFASWVGGDMDGNPNVGPETLRATLARHRALILARYRSELRELFEALSQSQNRVSIDQAILDRRDAYAKLYPKGQVNPRYSDMPYRGLISLMDYRLAALEKDDDDLGYERPEHFIDDLELIAASLRANRGRDAGLFLVERLIRRVKVFGFHLAVLDVRQDSLVHRRSIGDVLADAKFADRPAAERASRLEEAIRRNDALAGEGEAETERTLEVFRAIGRAQDRIGEKAIGPYIISMAQGPDDALAVLALAQAAGLGGQGPVPLDIAPLFETVPDLQNARATMASLFANRLYRDHLKTRGETQVIMLGYSDSNKESGIAASRWALYRAQEELVALCAEHGLSLTLFHGRGGTVSRGGTKPRDGILAAPPGAVAGRLRVTEQGEIIHAKYGLRGIAIRTMELTGGAVLEHSLLAQKKAPSKAWLEAAEKLAKDSRAAYRGLIYEDSGFYTFFREATPIDVIERLTMGSRPASRRAQKGIEDLRAIPWVFSWTQSRHVLTGWYGLGHGLAALESELGLNELREMRSRWPYFAALIGDAEMVLAKADMAIAKNYSALCQSQGARIGAIIETEFERCTDLILRIQDSPRLLHRDRTLQRSIRLRNPYVDPMSLMQIDLLQRWRASNREDKALEQALFTTVRGIARGLQNTG